MATQRRFRSQSLRQLPTTQVPALVPARSYTDRYETDGARASEQLQTDLAAATASPPLPSPSGPSSNFFSPPSFSSSPHSPSPSLSEEDARSQHPNPSLFQRAISAILWFVLPQSYTGRPTRLLVYDIVLSGVCAEAVGGGRGFGGWCLCWGGSWIWRVWGKTNKEGEYDKNERITNKNKPEEKEEEDEVEEEGKEEESASEGAPTLDSEIQGFTSENTHLHHSSTLPPPSSKTPYINFALALAFALAWALLTLALPFDSLIDNFFLRPLPRPFIDNLALPALDNLLITHQIPLEKTCGLIGRRIYFLTLPPSRVNPGPKYQKEYQKEKCIPKLCPGTLSFLHPVPHAVLSVPYNSKPPDEATRRQIQRTYRTLISLYHPDKIAFSHLSPATAMAITAIITHAVEALLSEADETRWKEAGVNWKLIQGAVGNEVYHRELVVEDVEAKVLYGNFERRVDRWEVLGWMAGGGRVTVRDIRKLRGGRGWDEQGLRN